MPLIFEKMSIVKKVSFILLIILIIIWFNYNFQEELNKNQEITKNNETNFVEKMQDFEISSFLNSKINYILRGKIYFVYKSGVNVLLDLNITIFNNEQKKWFITADKAYQQEQEIKLVDNIKITSKTSTQQFLASELLLKQQKIYSKKPVIYQSKSLKITSDKMILDTSVTPNISIFSTNVKVIFKKNQQIQEPKILLASTITILHIDEEVEQLIAEGSKNKLVIFKQKNKDITKNLNAQARKMFYDSQTNKIRLIENAKFSIGNEFFSGHKLDYDLTLDKLLIKGDEKNKEQVNIKYKL